MKKKLLSALLALPCFALAQFTQNFDAGTTLPTGWSVINGGDANTFAIGPASANSAYSLPNSAYIVYSAAAHDDYLVTPQFLVTDGVSDRLTFYVKNQDPNFVEDYAVKLSNAGNTAADFTVTLQASAPAPSSWTFVSIDLSAYEGQQVYVGFHATSADMFRLHLDDISVTGPAPTVAPNCPALAAPANGATDLDYNSLVLSWTAPAGGNVETYEVYADTNPNPITLIPSTATNATLSNLQHSTTYYWKVVAKNSAGEAVGCEIRSFTTKANPFAPYCSGNLLYSSGIEAITSVQFSDLTVTSPTPSTVPHESFVDQVATVEQGKTYPITFQGNTGGNYSNRFIVFVDWNQDGDFLDAGETYFSTTAVTLTNSTGTDGKTVVGNIAVPATALVGNTRMRVKKNFGSTASVNPCYSAGTLAAGTTTGYGQAEDYTLNVIEPTLGTVGAAKDALSVYPNPVSDILNITTADRKVLAVEFYSVDGKLAKSVSGNNQSVDVSGLQKGVYIVKVKTSAGEKSFKVIKK